MKRSMLSLHFLSVRHYDEYLRSLEDVVRLIDKSKNAKKAGDLSEDEHVYSLFDGIIAFTESHIRAIKDDV